MEVGMHDRVLRFISVVFLTGVLVHGADHLSRGTDVVTTYVVGAGAAQILLAVVAVVLVFRRHRLAPVAAVAVGLPGAALFAAVHLLPHWGAFSDAFTGSHAAPGVNGFSWFSALFEIAGDLAFGCAGLVMLWRRGIETAAPRVPEVRRSLA
jgi:hypothetical protein